MKKKIASIVLVICLMVSLLPMPMVSASATPGMDVVYVVEMPYAPANGTEDSPTSWTDALENVADGGTIYIMEDPVVIKQFEATKFEEY